MTETLYLGGRSGIYRRHLTRFVLLLFFFCFVFCLGGTCSANWDGDPVWGVSVCTVNLSFSSLSFFVVFHFSWQLLP